MWVCRFDYSGHGASEGVFSEGTIGTWKKDVLFMLDELAEGPQVRHQILSRCYLNIEVKCGNQYLEFVLCI